MSVEPSIINNEILAELSALMGEDLHELYDEFKIGTPEVLEKLKSEISSGNYRAVEALSHLLKSSSSNLGIQRFSILCGELEASAKRGDLQQANDIHQKIIGEFDVFSTYNFDIAC